jgi:hypothetical protein
VIDILTEANRAAKRARRERSMSDGFYGVEDMAGGKLRMRSIAMSPEKAELDMYGESPGILHCAIPPGLHSHRDHSLITVRHSFGLSLHRPCRLQAAFLGKLLQSLKLFLKQV